MRCENPFFYKLYNNGSRIEHTLKIRFVCRMGIFMQRNSSLSISSIRCRLRSDAILYVAIFVAVPIVSIIIAFAIIKYCRRKNSGRRESFLAEENDPDFSRCSMSFQRRRIDYVRPHSEIFLKPVYNEKNTENRLNLHRSYIKVVISKIESFAK
ncbi:hypothetical protein MHBO_002687 [Bonamia ostreae]|uniref:Uncharacterized protein n=1 Tax=Bonamia ostreae TaxID=126728 RepID=A0ABV2AN48_9EUKA